MKFSTEILWKISSSLFINISTETMKKIFYHSFISFYKKFFMFKITFIVFYNFHTKITIYILHFCSFFIFEFCFK